jgi:hypothetical protein
MWQSKSQDQRFSSGPVRGIAGEATAACESDEFEQEKGT